MKKRCILILLVVFVLMLLPWGYKEFVQKNFRYSTARESAEKSTPLGAKILEILENDGIALVIYQKNEGTVSQRILSQSEKGWTSMNYVHKSKKRNQIDGGIADLYEIGGRNIVNISVSVDDVKDIDNTVMDSMGNAYQVYAYEHGLGGAFVYYLLVIDEELPDDYKVYIGDYEIKIQ